MKAVLLTIFIASVSHAADLDLEFEQIKVSMRIGQMWGEDQGYRHGIMRLLLGGYSPSDLQSHAELSKYGQEMDLRNTEELKRIVGKWGWPKISEFGMQTDEQAWLLVQHADHDISFQETCLKLIEQALKTKDSNPTNFAYLWDRVKVNRGQLQRYGTQGACDGPKKWAPKPMEDAQNVNLRRREVSLGPLEEYVALMNGNCP